MTASLKTSSREGSRYVFSAVDSSEAFGSLFIRVGLQVVGCLCPKGFNGMFCGNASDACQGKPCFRGVKCQRASEPDQFTCGECPNNTFSEGKQGYKCFEEGLWLHSDFCFCADALAGLKMNEPLFLCLDVCSPPFPFPCHKDASCQSTRRNYMCTCKPGFTGDGRNCTGTSKSSARTTDAPTDPATRSSVGLCCRYR